MKLASELLKSVSPTRSSPKGRGRDAFAVSRRPQDAPKPTRERGGVGRPLSGHAQKRGKSPRTFLIPPETIPERIARNTPPPVSRFKPTSAATTTHSPSRLSSDFLEAGTRGGRRVFGLNEADNRENDEHSPKETRRQQYDRAFLGKSASRSRTIVVAAPESPAPSSTLSPSPPPFLGLNSPERSEAPHSEAQHSVTPYEAQLASLLNILESKGVSLEDAIHLISTNDVKRLLSRRNASGDPQREWTSATDTETEAEKAEERQYDGVTIRGGAQNPQAHKLRVDEQGGTRGIDTVPPLPLEKLSISRKLEHGRSPRSGARQGVHGEPTSPRDGPLYSARQQFDRMQQELRHPGTTSSRQIFSTEQPTTPSSIPTSGRSQGRPHAYSDGSHGLNIPDFHGSQGLNSPHSELSTGRRTSGEQKFGVSGSVLSSMFTAPSRESNTPRSPGYRRHRHSHSCDSRDSYTSTSESSDGTMDSTASRPRSHDRRRKMPRHKSGSSGSGSSGNGSSAPHETTAPSEILSNNSKSKVREGSVIGSEGSAFGPHKSRERKAARQEKRSRNRSRGRKSHRSRRRHETPAPAGSASQQVDGRYFDSNWHPGFYSLRNHGWPLEVRRPLSEVLLPRESLGRDQDEAPVLSRAPSASSDRHTFHYGMEDRVHIDSNAYRTYQRKISVGISSPFMAAPQGFPFPLGPQPTAYVSPHMYHHQGYLDPTFFQRRSENGMTAPLPAHGMNTGPGMPQVTQVGTRELLCDPIMCNTLSLLLCLLLQSMNPLQVPWPAYAPWLATAPNVHPAAYPFFPHAATAGMTPHVPPQPAQPPPHSPGWVYLPAFGIQPYSGPMGGMSTPTAAPQPQQRLQPPAATTEALDATSTEMPEGSDSGQEGTAHVIKPVHDSEGRPPSPARWEGHDEDEGAGGNEADKPQRPDEKHTRANRYSPHSSADHRMTRSSGRDTLSLMLDEAEGSSSHPRKSSSKPRLDSEDRGSLDSHQE